MQKKKFRFTQDEVKINISLKQQCSGFTKIYIRKGVRGKFARTLPCALLGLLSFFWVSTHSTCLSLVTKELCITCHGDLAIKDIAIILCYYLYGIYLTILLSILSGS